jgi:putative addiction module killer protein
MQVKRTFEFESWLAASSAKIRAQVEARIYRIENFDHFGDAEYLGDGLVELRWKNGLRVYFARTGNRLILLLHAGGKHDQKNDIKKARILLKRYTSAEA